MGLGKCNGCGEEVMWMKTRAGKNIPVNIPEFEFETARDAVMTAVEFDPHYMIAHFATCPKASKFRKKK